MLKTNNTNTNTNTNNNNNNNDDNNNNNNSDNNNNNNNNKYRDDIRRGTVISYGQMKHSLALVSNHLEMVSR